MKHLPRSFFAFLTAFCLCTGCSAPAAQTEPVKTTESTTASETVSAPSQEPEMTDETDISTPEDIEKAKGGKPWPDSQMKENITGMQATLKLVEKQENFDYDEFFRSYAWLWRIDSSYKRDMMILKDDPHPLAYLRVNTVVQQFDEFYETYDVKEGDGMYLAPEDRIVIW